MTAKPKFHPRCPMCDMLVDMSDGGKFMPFCCERCQLIDLGRWLNEEHALPCESEEDAEESVDQGGSTVRLPPGWHDA